MWSSSRWPWATGLVLLLGLRTSWVLPGAPDNAWGARQASLCSGKGSPGSSQVSQAPRRRHAVHSAQGQSRRGRGDHRGGPRDASGARLSAAPPPNWRRVSPGPATLTCEEAQGTHSPSEGPGWTHGHIRWASPGTHRAVSPQMWPGSQHSHQGTSWWREMLGCCSTPSRTLSPVVLGVGPWPEDDQGRGTPGPRRLLQLGGVGWAVQLQQEGGHEGGGRALQGNWGVTGSLCPLTRGN